MNTKKLYRTIFKTIKKESKILEKLVKQGIFFAPELYIAFLIGKSLKKNDEKIFGEKVTWIRETTIKNSNGPVDFLFQGNKKQYIFELKLRDTSHYYKKDIEKLIRLKEENRQLFFLALVDAWDVTDKIDPRIIELNKLSPNLKPVQEFKSFPILQSRYSQDQKCTVALWELI
jgi:hypothetical protein